MLYKHNRNSGAIYLMGYALELSLKRKLSQAFGFTRGFPETGAEFNSYGPQITALHALGIGIRRVNDIRIHNLNTLLNYSGFQLRITTTLYSEWLIVSTWTPESRYLRRRVTKQQAFDFLHAARLILQIIV
jgi:hypothetical protein